MDKATFTKETWQAITAMIVSTGVVIASVLMMYLIFITTIMLIGLVSSQI
jgi:hypothetical protein